MKRTKQLTTCNFYQRHKHTNKQKKTKTRLESRMAGEVKRRGCTWWNNQNQQKEKNYTTTENHNIEWNTTKVGTTLTPTETKLLEKKILQKPKLVPWPPPEDRILKRNILKKPTIFLKTSNECYFKIFRRQEPNYLIQTSLFDVVSNIIRPATVTFQQCFL